MLCLAAARLCAYTVISPAVYRSNGTVSDTQNAVNNVPLGGTVEIPNGTWDWPGTLSISRAPIIVSGQTLGQVTLNCHTASAIQINKQASGIITVRNLKMPAVGPTTGNLYQTHQIVVYGAWLNTQPFILHDCEIGRRASYSQWFSVGLYSIGGGLIYNCYFYVVDGAYAGQGIHSGVVGPEAVLSWSTPSTMGLEGDPNGTKNFYVEDCTFVHGSSGATDTDNGARMAVRHCTFVNAQVSNHGADSSPYGIRHMEVYDNTFVYNESLPFNWNGWTYWRGGTGVWTGNYMPDFPYGGAEFNFVCQPPQRRAGGYPCWPTYPVPHQVGQGYNNVPSPITGQLPVFYPYFNQYDYSYYLYTEPMYIWGNTGGGATTGVSKRLYPEPPQCNPSFSPETFMQAGRDYFYNQGAKPGWTRYPYPHPLRSGVVNTDPPAFVQQPAGATNTAGGTISLSASVAGALPITYQWRTNGVNFTGQTSSIITVTNAQLGHSGNYTLVASNAYGAVTSAIAVVVINAPVPTPPAITLHPTNRIVTVGFPVEFTGSASGSAPIWYQWQSNSVNILNATNQAYTISTVEFGHIGNYRFYATNLYGAATSIVATLSVVAAPTNTLRYVDFTAGNDANSGTIDMPWKLCPGMVGRTNFIPILTPGFTVYFDRSDEWLLGTNSAGPGFDLAAGVRYVGDEWDPEGAGSGKAKITATNGMVTGVVRFWYDDPQYATVLDGFEVNGGAFRHNVIDINHAFWKPGLTNTAKRVIDCLIHNNTGNHSLGDYATFGIIAGDNSSDQSGRVANVEVLDTVVHSVATDGICASAPFGGRIDNFTVRGCTVTNIGNDATINYSSGLLARGRVNNVNFERNYVAACEGAAILIDGPQTGTGPGPQLVVIANNILKGTNTSWGAIHMYTNGAKTVEIRNNYVLPSPVGLAMGGNRSNLTAKIYNNTFWDAPVVIGDPSGATSIEMLNNIFQTVSAVPMTDSGPDVTAHANNLYFAIGGGTFASSGGSSYTAGTIGGYEATAIATNAGFSATNQLPTGFTNSVPNTDGLMLAQDSPARQAGLLLSAPTYALDSINMIARPTTNAWDLGASQDISDPDPPEIPDAPRSLGRSVRNITILTRQE